MSFYSIYIFVQCICSDYVPTYSHLNFCVAEESTKHLWSHSEESMALN